MIPITARHPYISSSLQPIFSRGAHGDSGSNIARQGGAESRFCSRVGGRLRSHRERSDVILSAGEIASGVRPSNEDADNEDAETLQLSRAAWDINAGVSSSSPISHISQANIRSLHIAGRRLRVDGSMNFRGFWASHREVTGVETPYDTGGSQGSRADRIFTLAPRTDKACMLGQALLKSAQLANDMLCNRIALEPATNTVEPIPVGRNLPQESCSRRNIALPSTRSSATLTHLGGGSKNAIFLGESTVCWRRW